MVGDPITALTLPQPWATLVVHGHKRIETLTCRTPYRGRLAIHASETISDDAVALYFQEPFRAALRASGVMSPDDLVRGAIIGYVNVVDCIRSGSKRLAEISDQERAFGDFTRGRWAWIFTDPAPLTDPIPAPDGEGLWQLDPWA
jgi:activating signal cointegrator 1